MRISDLSRESGVPIPTLKFYLREGLLPAGARTAPNQATYGAIHLRRLYLIRAVRRVLAGLERDGAPLHDILSEAHGALPSASRTAKPALAPTRAETDAWLARLGWDLGEGSPARDDLANALLALRGLGWDVGPEVFERYAQHASALAEAEIAYVAEAPRAEAAIEATIIGTVVFERALVALRRLAQEHHSRTRFG
jgi:DNA-binding transcriptional MerR regulator